MRHIKKASAVNEHYSLPLRAGESHRDRSTPAPRMAQEGATLGQRVGVFAPPEVAGCGGWTVCQSGAMAWLVVKRPRAGHSGPERGDLARVAKARPTTTRVYRVCEFQWIQLEIENQKKKEN